MTTPANAAVIAPPATVAFLGTGLMGLPMAQNLRRAGFQLRVWNRSPDKAAPLLAAGATVTATPAEAVRDCAAVILMLQDGTAVSKTLFARGVEAACAPGTLVVDMSSISPTVAQDHAAALSRAGLRYLDAPVSGGTVGAEAGTLMIMVGGNAADFAAAETLFSAMGASHRVGEAGQGQFCKLANLTLVAVTIGAVAEALTLARAGGADPAVVREILLGGFSQSRILEVHGERMIRRNFTPGGRIKNQLKDLDTILAVAATHGVQMPLTTRTRELFAALRDRHGDELDHSALVLQIEAMRGHGDGGGGDGPR